MHDISIEIFLKLIFSYNEFIKYIQKIDKN
jgi:hypothetical protein